MKYRKLLMVCLCATIFAACSSDSSKSGVSGSSDPAAAEKTITPAPDSKFAKVTVGMSQRQVEDLIGPPSDIKAGIGGKAFIPFYNVIENDTTYTHAFYKNEGILTFQGGDANMLGNNSGRLTRIQVNTTEDGYNN